MTPVLRKGHLSLLLSYLFGTHRFKHLLKLDTQLLDIIHQDAWLRTNKETQRDLLRKKGKNIYFSLYSINVLNASNQRQTKYFNINMDVENK